MDKINVMIVDDQPIVRDGLKMILEMQEDINIACMAQDGKEAIKYANNTAIDIILMDIRMPNIDGVEATKEIKQKHDKIKIIVLTTFDDDEYIFEALKNGASSYLLKDINSEEIVNAIRTVYKGGSMMQPKVTAKVISQFSKFTNNKPSKGDFSITKDALTAREIDIIKLIASGMSNKEIANTLFLSEGTVKNHITNILSKLNMRDRTQVALYAIENKIL